SAGSHTVWFNPAASGSFTLNATASDAGSGIAQVNFPNLSTIPGWTGSTGGNATSSPYASPAAYSWSSGAPSLGVLSIVATSGAGRTASDSIAISADSLAPTGHAVA